MEFPTYKYETQKISEGFRFIAGCDEVGIGPLAGPVVAASVILDPESVAGNRTKEKWWFRIRDSKTVNEKERNELAKFIYDYATDFFLGVVPHATIDKINIHQAALLAMQESVNGLKQKPDFLFLDGIHKIKNLNLEQEAVVKGDSKVLSIAAASIVAKVARDKILDELHEMYPQYGFAKHKGYPTKQHREAIIKFGASPVHRLSFTLVQPAGK